MVCPGQVLNTREMLSVLVKVWAREKVSAQTASLGSCAELEREKSWDHTVFCSDKKRDQTHKLMLILSSICPLRTRTSFSHFWGNCFGSMQASFLDSYFCDWLRNTYCTSWRKVISCHMDWVLLSLSSFFGRKCLPLCVFLRIFNVSCCREAAAASSLGLEDVYSAYLRVQEE